MQWPKDEKGVPFIIDATSLVNLVENSTEGEHSIITLLLNLNLMVQTLCYKAESIKKNECEDPNALAIQAKERTNLEQHRKWVSAVGNLEQYSVEVLIEEARHMEASFTDGDLRALAKYAAGSEVIVELGTFKGGTTWFLATFFPKSLIITVDEHWPPYIEILPVQFDEF